MSATTAGATAVQKGRVFVAVRVRPPNANENPTDAAVACDGSVVHLESRMGESKPYNFDAVFGEKSTQDQIFKRIGAPVVESALEGYNGALLAYGQTGSGKTYTLGNNLDEKERGITPRAIAMIFDRIAADKKHSYSVHLSYVQIYCEMIQDLLSPANDRVQLREDVAEGGEGVFMVGVTSTPVKCLADCLTLLDQGNQNRSTAFTLMNATSSRSHACLIIKVQEYFFL
jgi:kinesin family protein 5